MMILHPALAKWLRERGELPEKFIIVEKLRNPTAAEMAAIDVTWRMKEAAFHAR